MMTSKTLALIDPAIIVWTCIFEAAGSKAEWSISYIQLPISHCYTF